MDPPFPLRHTAEKAGAYSRPGEKTDASPFFRAPDAGYPLYDIGYRCRLGKRQLKTISEEYRKTVKEKQPDMLAPLRAQEKSIRIRLGGISGESGIAV